MRAAQEICRRRPKCHILIIGGDGVSYGRRLEGNKTYRQKMLEEVEIDPQRVHFLGQIPYDQYLRVLRVSSAHVYLTVPFVLSWSMLEAMSAGCLVIGSNTAPVLEALEHERNGLVVDFFSPSGIADAVDEALGHKKKMVKLRKRAREFVVENYTVQRSLTQYRELVEGLGVKIES
jgi:glycosyltransferase involved in cell wall biosynthesis